MIEFIWEEEISATRRRRCEISKEMIERCIEHLNANAKYDKAGIISEDEIVKILNFELSSLDAMRYDDNLFWFEAVNKYFNECMKTCGFVKGMDIHNVEWVDQEAKKVYDPFYC